MIGINMENRRMYGRTLCAIIKHINIIDLTKKTYQTTRHLSKI